MSVSGSGHRHAKREDKIDEPPMSRLFIICNKANTEEDVRKAFEKFGIIEEIWVVKDKQTGENKGVVYVKFSKTSSAARALEEMHGKVMGSAQRSIKVLVASNRNQGSGRSENEHEKYVRLFVLVPKDVTEEELTSEFEQYGDLESISVIKDKVTRERKGFAYIRYGKFSHAANAFENCNSKYKAVFAEPRSSQRNNPNDRSSNNRYDDQYNSYGSGNGGGGGVSSSSGGGGGGNNSNHHHHHHNRNIDANFHFTTNQTANSGETQLSVICSSLCNQDQLWRLFDIIPGLDYCQITGENRNSNYATVVYSNPVATAYAREKLHGLEYPPGERLIIKPISDIKLNANTDNMLFQFDSNLIGCSSSSSSVAAGGGGGGGQQLSSFGGGGNTVIKDVFCSVKLPDAQPLASSTALTLQRCFIVCVPKALPQKLLLSVFSRFGDLIDVYMLPNKNCGYAKYASEDSANRAIETLNGAEVDGVRLKVLEAEEPRDAKRKRYDED